MFQKIANQHFGLKDDHTLVAQGVKQVAAKGVMLDLKRYQQDIIADTNIKATSFDDLKGKIAPADMAKLEIAGNDLQDAFERLIKEHLGSFRSIKRSIPVVKTAIYCWFQAYLGSRLWPEEILLIQKVVLHDENRPVFERILIKAIEAYRSVKEEEVKRRVEATEQNYSLELPGEIFYNEHADELVTKSKKYAYHPCYLNVDRSDPEKRFEAFLNEHEDEIDWWWKNGEDKLDYFGIKYSYENTIHTFYPDYLVQLKDGRLGIFEVKDAGDRDGKTLTKTKAEAFYSWLISQKRKDIFGGVAIQRNSMWFLNRRKIYDWGRCERGDWSEWEDLGLEIEA